MLEQITAGLAIAAGAAALSVVRPLLAWLREKAKEVRVLNRTRIDDIVLDALETGVENVANSLKPRLIAAAEGGRLTAADKRLLRDEALDQARAILRDRGVELAETVSQEAADAIIRRLVDSIEENRN